MLEVLLRNIDTGAVNTKRELYYIAKGEIKHNPSLKPLDFADQDESDAIIDFICEMLECYREEMNCFCQRPRWANVFEAVDCYRTNAER
jgi:DNA topoisomerase-6 subunit A